MKAPSFTHILAGIAMLSLAGCSPSTKVVQSWKAPGVSVESGSYNKMLVIGLLKDETTRRIAEDRMANFLNGHGVTSYSYLGQDQTSINDPGMAERLEKDGIDAVLIMSLVDQKTESSYVPGSTMGYGGYYGYAYPMYSSPGYIVTDHTYYVETQLYSTKAEGPLWTSITSTLNPTNVSNSIDAIMAAVYAKMKEEGFVRTPAK